MNEITNFFQQLEYLNKINVKELIDNIYNENQEYKIIINNLTKELDLMKKNLVEIEKNSKDKDDELSNYKKSSILTSMSKQIFEQKKYISILERQVEQSKIKLNNLPNSNQILPSTSVLEQQNSNIINNETNTNLDNNNNINNDALDTKSQINELNSIESNTSKYEIVKYKNKSYYVKGKKVYLMNDDKTRGEYYGKYKNGKIKADK